MFRRPPRPEPCGSLAATPSHTQAMRRNPRNQHMVPIAPVLIFSSGRWGRTGAEWSRLFEEGELLECAWSEVTHVVGLMALKQRGDAIAPWRRCRHIQEQFTLFQAFCIVRQDRLVLADALKCPDDTASQAVVFAVLIQDCCASLAAQDLH